jgi:hypothetical protein
MKNASTENVSSASSLWVLGSRRKDMSLLDCFIMENKVVLQAKEH